MRNKIINIATKRKFADMGFEIPIHLVNTKNADDFQTQCNADIRSLESFKAIECRRTDTVKEKDEHGNSGGFLVSYKKGR